MDDDNLFAEFGDHNRELMKRKMQECVKEAYESRLTR